MLVEQANKTLKCSRLQLPPRLQAIFLSKFTIFEKLISSKMHTGDLFFSLCTFTFTHTTLPEKHKELNNRHLLTDIVPEFLTEKMFLFCKSCSLVLYPH